MTEKILPFQGSGVALVTPFKNGKVDYSALQKLISFHLANRTDALVICATTGESPTLKDDERAEIIRFTVQQVNKQIPVIVGTGSNCTEKAIHFSQEAEQLGADGLLLITPFYNKTSQAGLIRHFSEFA